MREGFDDGIPQKRAVSILNLREEEVASEFDEGLVGRRRESEGDFGSERGIFYESCCYDSSVDLIHVFQGFAVSQEEEGRVD